MPNDHFGLDNKDCYKFWTEDVVRAADIDFLNHVNNVSTPVFCESGRVALWEKMREQINHESKFHTVLVSAHYQYLKVAYYPDKIRIGTKIMKIGNSSVTLGQGIFNKNGCFSTAIAICVWADVKNERSIPLPEEAKNFLNDFL